MVKLATARRKAKRDGWDYWIRSPQDELAAMQGCWFDTDRALAAVNFVQQRLTHSKDRFRGKPFLLEEFQIRDIIAPLYGWRTKDDRRRFRNVFIFIPKKNGKTQIAAAVSLLELHYCPGPRVYIAATSKGQAGECFEEAASMVNNSRLLRKRLDVRASTNRILYPNRGGLIHALGTKAATSEGKNASALILDELHAWTDREFFDSLLFAGASRLDPLLFMITTAGKDISSLCYSEYERACRIRDGLDMSTDYLSVVYEAPKGSAWDDLSAWKIANPNYGVTLPEENILADIAAARGYPARIAAIKRYRLNIWTNESATWLDTLKWRECDLIAN